MKNYEKYADEIKKYKDSKGGYFCNEFIMPHILKKDSCAGIGCEHCHMLQMLWLLGECEETKEPKVDWSKVGVDTPILVRNTEDEEWRKRYFAKYDKYGFVYTWKSGGTSWTEEDLCVWNFAKLPEDEGEPEVDWSKVEVDTPILVRHSEKAEWIRRYFAKYENGLVYAWGSGLTSWTTHGMTTAWQFAKLAENEEE